MNDCHYWDVLIHQNFSDYLKKLPELSPGEDGEMWNDLFSHSEKVGNPIHPVLKMIEKQAIFDPNVNYCTRMLGARVWKKIKDQPDLHQVLFSQIKDMIETRGFCPQGRTNRFIQVLFASESL